MRCVRLAAILAVTWATACAPPSPNSLQQNDAMSDDVATDNGLDGADLDTTAPSGPSSPSPSASAGTSAGTAKAIDASRERSQHARDEATHERTAAAAAATPAPPQGGAGAPPPAAPPAGDGSTPPPQGGGGFFGDDDDFFGIF